jgi:ATP adenylyltransferase
MAQGLRLPPGGLSAAIAARSASALRAGALVPIPTEVHVVEDGGIAFVVRVVAALAGKREAARADAAGARNPFLPFEPELFVADVSDTHLCLLNKFNAVDRHALVVTRRFEDQEEPLGRSDFEALWACLGETRGLGFYNSGAVAGASQRHKHLQLVPLPLGPGPPFPLAPMLESCAPASGVSVPSALPFPAALARVDGLAARPPGDAALALEALYREMLRRIGGGPRPTPYNLLATRRLLWLVPRSHPEWQGIPVNALGYAGALLVPDAPALARLRAAGPLACLRAVAADLAAPCV